MHVTETMTRVMMCSGGNIELECNPGCLSCRLYVDREALENGATSHWAMALSCSRWLPRVWGEYWVSLPQPWDSTVALVNHRCPACHIYTSPTTTTTIRNNLLVSVSYLGGGLINPGSPSGLTVSYLRHDVCAIPPDSHRLHSRLRSDLARPNGLTERIGSNFNDSAQLKVIIGR
jgi:hypothetical protein